MGHRREREAGGRSVLSTSWKSLHSSSQRPLTLLPRRAWTSSRIRPFLFFFLTPRRLFQVRPNGPDHDAQWYRCIHQRWKEPKWLGNQMSWFLLSLMPSQILLQHFGETLHFSEDQQY